VNILTGGAGPKRCVVAAAVRPADKGGL